MFSKKEGELKNASYQITGNSNTIKNLVCDLEPNYNYAVGLNGNNILTIAAGKDGTIYFEINDLNGIGNISIEQGTVGVVDEIAKINVFRLEQNYPNPFNPSTTIKYTIPSLQTPLMGGVGSELVTLKVYNVLGQEVATLVNQKQSPGNYEVIFNANNLPSEVYFYRITIGTYINTKKLIIMK